MLEDKYINRLLLILIALLFSQLLFSQSDELTYPKAKVSFDDYEGLIHQVKSERKKRLISFEQFLEFQKEPNTIILDTRSNEKYEAKHIKGAINLPFTEFTQSNLRRLIPNTETKILVYCNNNFKGDEVNFASKTAKITSKVLMLRSRDEITLALNIPTYINLYGYGYRNIYELHELVHINDPRLELDGNDVFLRLSKEVISVSIKQKEKSTKGVNQN